MTSNEFKVLRKAVIEKEFSSMNDMQFKAVTKTDGPVLVLAGAGSGKTTVLVNRIAYLIKYGDAYNTEFVPDFTDEDIACAEAYLKGMSDTMPDSWSFSYRAAKPWEILAITFTNKAANELKERISAKLQSEESGVWAGTFHSVCGKILRRFGDRVGYTSNFTIYDTDDQKRVVKDIMKQNNFDEKVLNPKAVINAISSAKEKLIDEQEYKNSVGEDYRNKMIAAIYCEYEERLRAADAMDFDGMIANTVKLLLENEDVADYYGNRFKYVMVDEYQDTNHAQYVLVKLLSQTHKNLCVVGDDDQSIYRFRGATIENILNFEKQYKKATVIKLEQNYRSVGNILDAANAVISNNIGRKGKNLWTDKGSGDKITVHTAQDESDEARYVANTILDNVKNGAKFSDHAILYRMNAQSSAVENVFARSAISYKVIGGHKFFERKEIKDVLAYLHLINNHKDDVRLKRIINEPKRSIGDTTVSRAGEIAASLRVSIFEVIREAYEYPILSRSSSKLKEFCDMIEDLSSASRQMPIHELFDLMLNKTGYLDALLAEGPEGKERAENVKELASGIMQYEQENENATLSGYLEEISLFSDIDNYNSDSDSVVMMTVHSAKGLEFKNVFIVGMEEGIFPGNQTIYSTPDEMEEERRLAYVAITRAKERLYITKADLRMLYGATSRNRASRFIGEIPEKLVNITGTKPAWNDFSKDSFGRSYGNSNREGFFDRSAQYDYSSVFARPCEPKPKANMCEYTVGMVVEHKTFGKGMILKVSPMGNDAMLEIAFDSVGTKKIMAGFARLTKG
ncbi:MAG: UvrD-helicase domain-containing protein [Clostridia bacterium]|nr:UvrD-helicase domain-containing protein [Clostridia bacterium]